MNKLDYSDLDQLLKQSAPNIVPDAPLEPSEEKPRTPLLRSPIDKAVGAAGALAAGAVGLAASARKINTRLPLQEIPS